MFFIMLESMPTYQSSIYSKKQQNYKVRMLEGVHNYGETCDFYDWLYKENCNFDFIIENFSCWLNIF